MRNSATLLPLLAFAVGSCAKPLPPAPAVPPCEVPAGTSTTVSSVVSVRQIASRLLVGRREGQVALTSAVAQVQADGPIVIVNMPKGTCTDYVAETKTGGCQWLYTKPLRSAQAGQRLGAGGEVEVLGRADRGGQIRVDLLAHRDATVVRLDALDTLDAREGPGEEGKIQVTATVTAAVCAPTRQDLIVSLRPFVASGELPCEVSGEVCSTAGPTCDPERGGAWKVVQCIGQREQCDTTPCEAGRVGSPVCTQIQHHREVPSADASVLLRAVVTGRSKGSVRAELRTGWHGGGCGCAETGWSLSCDASCLVETPCVRPEPAPDTTTLTWQGWGIAPSGAPSPRALQIGNLGSRLTVFGTFSTGAPGFLGAPFSPSLSSATISSLEGAAVSPDGSEWYALTTNGRSKEGYEERGNVIVRVVGGQSTSIPLPSYDSGGDHAKVGAIAPDPDGKGVFAMMYLRAPAVVGGQMIPSLREGRSPGDRRDRPGSFLVHLSDLGVLLGWSELETYGYPVPGASFVASPSSGTPYRVALLSTGEGGVALRAVDGRAKVVWERVLDRAPAARGALRADAKGQLWVGLQGEQPISGSAFPSLNGHPGGELLLISPEGTLLQQVQADVVSLAPSEDGTTAWTLEGKKGAPSLWLRQRGADGQMRMEHPVRVDPTTSAHFDLLPLANNEIVVSRRDVSEGQVVSRWSVGKGSLSLRWIERLAVQPVWSDATASTWDARAKAIRVMGLFFVPGTEGSPWTPALRLLLSP